jgi:hypothetical protein
MNNETPADLARILSFAATYMEEHGRARFRFGGLAGRAACPVAAIGIALGFNPRRIGRGWFFSRPNEVHRAVGSVILRTGLLNDLPVPQRPYGQRKLRPATMSPFDAVVELASWSDDKALDVHVSGALRHRAITLMASWSQGTWRSGLYGATQEHGAAQGGRGHDASEEWRPMAGHSKSIGEAASHRGVLLVGRQPAGDRNDKQESHGSQS